MTTRRYELEISTFFRSCSDARHYYGSIRRYMRLSGFGPEFLDVRFRPVIIRRCDSPAAVEARARAEMKRRRIRKRLRVLAEINHQ